MIVDVPSYGKFNVEPPEISWPCPASYRGKGQHDLKPQMKFAGMLPYSPTHYVEHWYCERCRIRFQ